MGWEQIIFPARLNPMFIWINVCDFRQGIIFDHGNYLLPI